MGISNRLVISEPTTQVANYCADKLTLANPEYMKKKMMNKWVGNTPLELELYEVRDGKLILPYGCLRNIIPYFTKQDTIVPLFQTAPKVRMGEPIPLYDYQEEAVSEMIRQIYGILQSKAGSGKTQMGLAIAQRLKCKTLWLTHTIDLLNQSYERAVKYIPEELLGTITAGKVHIGESITFATIQTMALLDLTEYRNIWDTIIVDECHRVCGTPTAVTQFSKVLNSLAARHKYGLSATVHRADGLIQATYALLGDVRYRVPDEACADKVMPVGIKLVQTNVKYSDECFNSDGTIYFIGMINYLVEHPERNKIINDIIKSNKDEYILVLSDRIKHLDILYNNLPKELQKYAAIIKGDLQTKTAKKHREDCIKQMREGTLHILFATYKLAKEGLDIPRLNRLILATPQKDYAVITQAIGRIARVFDGKNEAICFDVLDDIDYLRRMFGKRKTSYKKADCYFV